MKTLFIGTTALILAIASFSSAAYGNVDGSNKGVCQSIPPTRPTGGGTRQRLQAIKRCNEAQSRGQQTPNTSPTEQPNPSSTVPSPTRQSQDSNSSMQPWTPSQD